MKVFLLYATAGLGHKKAAESLFEEFQRQGFRGHVPVRVPGGTNRYVSPEVEVSLYDVLHYSVPPFRKGYPFFYYLLVHHAFWLWWLFYEITDREFLAPLVSRVRSAVNGCVGRPLEQFLVKENPSVILSTQFYASEVAARLKRSEKIRSKVFTVITDFSVHSFWVNEGTDLYFVMAESTKKELLARGVPGEKIRVTGIPVSGRFGERKDVARIRQSLGLQNGRMTLLITSGSFGMGPIRRILAGLEKLSERIQVILVCGHNRRLLRQVGTMRTSLRISCFGFVKNMDELMCASDLCLSRSSGLTTTESLVVGVPMVIYELIPGQEARNARFLLQEAVCWREKEPAQISELIDFLLRNPEMLRKVRERMSLLAKPQAASDIVEASIQSGYE